MVMGLLKKMEKEPALRIKDWRKEYSIRGLMINARTKGARSKFSLRKLYPRIPEPQRTIKSTVLELTE
jgi:hypothetical protein